MITRYARFLIITVLFLPLGLRHAAAQDAALTLSKHADFSTADREFGVGDVVHVRVKAPDVDPADLDQNELRVSAEREDGHESFVWRLPLTNHFDGTYTAALDSLHAGEWYLRAIVADGKGAAFEGDATFYVGAPNEHTELRIEGLIEELGETSLVIMDRRLFVVPDTKIVDKDGTEIPFSALRIGDRVLVVFTGSFTGELIALRVERRNRDNAEVSLRGQIQEIGDNELVVLDRRVLVDSATVIIDEYGQHIRFDQLDEGDIVELVGMELDGGAILAFKIYRADSHPDEIELTGPIQELGEESLVVLDRRFLVSNDTEIIGPDGGEISFGDLRVGLIVKVHAKRTESDNATSPTFVATHIKVLEEARFVVEGEIDELGESRIVVEEIPFVVNDRTEILTSSGVPLRFSDLQQGFTVSVLATKASTSNALVALRIVVLRPSIEIRTITGFITEIDGDLIVVNGFVIRVADRTEIVGTDGQAIRFEDLSVGVRVRVSATHFVTNTLDLRVLVAERIQVLPDREKRVTGRIRAVSESSIQIASVEAAITNTTKILNQEGDPIGVGDLSVGMLAAMHVVETSTGIVATTIRLLPRLEDEIGVAGVVEATGDSSLVVLGQTFFVLPNTVIRNESGEKIDLGSLEVGRAVALRGELLAGGTLVALHVQQLARGINGIKAFGPVESVGATTLEVIGVHFFVDNDTKLYDLERNEINLAQINVGQTVLVNAEGQPDGTRLAKTVQLMDVTVSAGDVSVSTDGTITLLGAHYNVAPDVMVISNDIVAIDADALTSGMYVEVHGSRIDEGVYTVTKVKVLSAESVGLGQVDTPIADGGVVLRPNYPNPFSDQTTIELEISDDHNVVNATVTVYDVTGRRVTTLLDAALVPGKYSVAWDGRDETGNVVASGLYFYQVRAGDASVARAMMLLK